MFLLFLADFFGNRKRVDVDRDGVVQQPKVCQTLDDAGVSRARPAAQADERMIVPIEEKSEVALSVSLAVPAVFLNRQFGSESLSWIKIKTFRQRRIEESLVMPEVVQVVHRQDTRAGAGEDFKQQPVNVLEFAHKLIEQRGVVIPPGGRRLEAGRRAFQHARDVKNHAL